MDIVTASLLGAGTVGLTPAIVFGCMITDISLRLRSEPKEHLTARQWEELWATKKEWLASVVTQKNTLSTSETLEEFVRILTFSGAPIKGYAPSAKRAFKEASTEHAQMCLTFIPYRDNKGNWYRSHNYVPAKAEANGTLLPVVQGLRTLAKSGEEFPETGEDWNSRLSEFIQDYASQLLLNYRELKEDKFKAVDDWEETVGRQEALNARMEFLVNALAGKKTSVTAKGLEKAMVEARQIEASKNGDTLALEALTPEEREVVQAFRTKKEVLALPAQITGEALIQKMRASAEVSSDAVGETPGIVIEIADENRSIAASSLGRILEKEEDSDRSDLVKQLRADNLYLRQKSEELQ